MPIKDSMLIIDDSIFARDNFKRLFQNDFDILEARDGEQGLEFIKQYKNHLSVILLDIAMPKMSGIDVLKSLSESKLGMDIPVIAITSEEKYQIDALKYGAWDFITKQSADEVIVARVNNIIFRNKFNQQEQERIKFEKSMDSVNRFREIMDNVTSGIIVIECKPDGKCRTIYITESFCKMLNSDKKTVMDIYGEDAYAGVHPEDLDRVKKACTNAIRNNQKFMESYRLTNGNGDYKWISINADIVKNPNGRILMYAVYNDIDKQKSAEIDLKMSRSMLLAAAEHADLYYWEYYPSKSLCINGERSVKELGMPQYMENYPQSLFETGLVHPDDIGKYFDLCNKIKNGIPYADIVIREKNTDGGYTWKYTKYTTIFDDKNNVVKAFATTKSINDYKDLEERFALACKQSGISVWNFDIPNATIIQENNSIKIYGEQETISNVPQSLFDMDIIHQDDIKNAEEMYQKLRNGEKLVECILRLKKNNSDIYWWAKVVYTTVFDKYGKPIRALGTATDVTEEQYTKEKYLSEMNLREEALKSEFVYSLRINLTNDVFIYSSDNYKKETDPITNKSVDEIFKIFSNNIRDAKQREHFLEIFTRKKLIEAYYRGDRNFNLEYRRKVDNGHNEWVSTTVNLLSDPVVGDIIAFIYTRNIQQENTTKAIVNSVVKNDYDYVMVIDIKDNMLRPYNIGKTDLKNKIYYKDARKIFEEYLRENCSENQQEVIKENRFNYIVRMLDLYGKYSTTCSIKTISGSVKRKIFRYYFIDKENMLICFSCQDITGVYEDDQQKKKALEIALKAAEQASVAKSEFLARMSHEMRTPMNVILGMTAIASQSLEDKQQIVDCIAKINVSSNFLLSLINDILDMSKIESGKVLLKSEKFSFQELINSVNTICHTQCIERSIEYICTIDTKIEEFYIGDKMKLQQIIINVLSNAVKFTPQKGSITLDIRQISSNEKNAKLQFTIRDTGCGIGREFLPQIFNAFSQEYSGSTSCYGGTGLGLSICKNLVALMDGKIDVNSELGKGTEFIIVVKVGRYNSSHYADKFDFSKCNLLLVHDDDHIAKHRLSMLRDIGVNVKLVKNQSLCIESLVAADKSGSSFDIVLLDNRENLDGDTIAKKVRETANIKQPYIINTSFSWDNTNSDAQAAGVDFILPKPMFKPPLKKAILDAMSGKKADSNENVSIDDYDFSGKRILLVEDHPLNIEVAKKLLQIKGPEIECAVNGKNAVDMFETSDCNYYDLVLMDIRMPVMDGLDATRKIRSLQKSDSKTVPIVAMTANAFDEDIETAIKAGMNAHIAKPIEPKILYHTIARFLKN